MVVVEALRIRRTGWVVVGMVMALVAVSALAWSSGAWRASASDAAESTLVPVTPTRVLDTRIGLGLEGPFGSGSPRELRVTGEIATADGVAVVVPDGATGVVLNVTVVQPTAAGFVSVRPAGTPGSPTTSNLNFEAGVITPNAVSVQLPTAGPDAGRIEVTYDAFGAVGPTADMLIDLVAYTSSSGLADLAARVSALEGQVGSLQSDLSSANTAIGTLQSDLSSANAAMGTLQSEVATKQDACADGAVLAFGRVPQSPGSSFVDVGWTCDGAALQARRVGNGHYIVRWPGRDLANDDVVLQMTSTGDPLRGHAVGRLDVTASDDVTVYVMAVDDANTNFLQDAPFDIIVLAAPPS